MPPIFYARPKIGGSAGGRTFRQLSDEALALVRRGRIPSVAEVAQSAGVSRATAYRYFPSRGKLIGALVAEALAPVRKYVPREGEDGLARLNVLVDKTYPRFRKYEPHLRAALQVALEHQSLQRAGLLEEEPFRRGQRREILRLATEPLRPKLSTAGYERLLKALDRRARQRAVGGYARGRAAGSVRAHAAQLRRAADRKPAGAARHHVLDGRRRNARWHPRRWSR